MANVKRSSKEAKCIPIPTLTKRLAASFAAINWPVDATLGVDTTADHLGIQVEHVEALIAAGLLATVKGNRYRVDPREVMRFVDANPWWYGARAAAQQQHLRDELHAMAYRERRERLKARRAARNGGAA